MATIAQFIEENKTVYEKLVKARYIPMSCVRKFQVYVYYSGLTGSSKMQNYQITADAMGLNERDVRKAIKEMEKSI